MNSVSSHDRKWMRRAIALARRGEGHTRPNPPVGAVVVYGTGKLGEGFHRRAGEAHAEVVALDACRGAARGATLYVTLEPCTMCFGALIHARVGRIVFATFEPKSGVVGSQMNLSQMGFYNHQAMVSQGLLSCECSQMLSQFFAKRRADKRLAKQMANSTV